MQGLISDLVALRHEVQTVLLVIVQLCQRNSGKMDEAGREVNEFMFVVNSIFLISA